MNRALGALLSRAMTASVETSFIEDGEGNTATIERDPTYPGAFCVRVQPAEDPSARREEWVLPAASERPAFFPQGVRFLTGLSCTAAFHGRTARITWKDDAELERSFPPSLREALEARSSEPGTGETPEGEVSVLSVAEELGDRSAVEWVLALNRPSSPAPRFITIFEGMVEEWVDEGWREEAAQIESPHVARSTRLTRNGDERTLILALVCGMDMLTMADRQAAPDRYVLPNHRR